MGVEVLIFVLVTCVYLHLGGMYFCDDGGQVSPSVMVLAANLCVGGLFICGCSSPSVMMTGADCGPCWQPVFISILVVCVYVCDDDWC